MIDTIAQFDWDLWSRLWLVLYGLCAIGLAWAIDKRDSQG